MITKITLVVAMTLLFAFSCNAQKNDFQKNDFFKPYGKSFVVSTSVYTAGAIADLSTSRGLVEKNPLARNSRGGLDMKKGIALKSGLFVSTLFLEKKHPKLAFWIRALSGGIFGVVAVHNSRISRFR